LAFSELSFSTLNPIRQRLISVLTSLPPEEGRMVLRLSANQDQELKNNMALWEAATLPALDRYTGVLYDALSAHTLPQVSRSRLFIASALFGLLGAEDLIPAYRISAGTKLPGIGGLAKVWKPALTSVLLTSCDGLVVDLRSGAYAALAPMSGVVTVRVVTSEGKVVSHHNKATKGLLARALAISPIETVSELVEVARAANIAAMQINASTVEIVRD
jgi:cytoplasmic iron level regulating protein YaaA (DUF328/UPF0246 family)